MMWLWLVVFCVRWIVDSVVLVLELIMCIILYDGISWVSVLVIIILVLYGVLKDRLLLMVCLIVWCMVGWLWLMIIGFYDLM